MSSAGASLDRDARPPGRGWGRQARRVAPLLTILVVLAALLRAGWGFDWGSTGAQLRAVDGRWFALALAVFYAGFLARCWRWRVLLGNAGVAAAGEGMLPPFLALTGIMYRAWFVNNVTVARAGDAYRAYLLKRRAGASLARTMATVVVERIVDLVVLAALLVPAVLIAFRSHLPADAAWAVRGAIAVAALGPLFLFGARWLAPAVVRRLPARVAPAAGHFADAITTSLRRIPLLILMTGLGWAGECLTLALVAHAVGVHLSPAQAATAALVTALLSTLPVTPGGLGVADAGLVLLLSQVGVGTSAALSVAILTRAITFGSVLLGGGAAMLVGTWSERRAPLPLAGAAD